MTLNRLIAICAGLLAISSAPVAAGQMATPVSAQPRQVVAPPASAPALSQTDVGAWLDGFMPYALKSGNIAGGVVVVVKDGQVLFERGYGYADVAKRTPVSATGTMFRPGSISKLFTWTAVMQLVEAGKLDLDADVNRYLDFTIPPRNGRPITLRNIMTHTTGFEEAARNLITEDPKKTVELRAALVRWVPQRIFDPGTTPDYSNYATALAGYIVQRVSGEPFDNYVERHIFSPLGMMHATFRQPLPTALAPMMSSGYRLASSPAHGYEFVALAPAGAAAMTGDDMARFMIAHLQDGRFGNTAILRPETARLMHTSVTRLLPPLNGIALGFYEQNINGHRVISHGGDTALFHSDLWLFSNDQVGLFVSVNSAGQNAGRLRQSLFEGFADRYFPDPAPQPPTLPLARAKADAAIMAGQYQSTRRSESNFLALGGLLGAVAVVPNPDGTINVGEKKLREVAPFLWHEIGGHDRLRAIVANNKVERFAFDTSVIALAFEPYPAAQSPAWMVPCVIAALIVLMLTALAWPITAVVRRHYGQAFALGGVRATTYRATRVAAILAVAGGVVWVTIISALAAAQFPSDLTLHIAQLLTALGAVGGLIAAAANLWAIRQSGGRWGSWLWGVLLLLAFGMTTYVALVYRLIGFSTNY